MSVQGGRPPRAVLTDHVNCFAVHYDDAVRCLKMAAAADQKEMASLSRAAILNFHVALEALQNRFYAEFINPKHPALLVSPLDRLPYATRWYLAPVLSRVIVRTGRYYSASIVSLGRRSRNSPTFGTPWPMRVELARRYGSSRALIDAITPRS